MTHDASHFPSRPKVVSRRSTPLVTPVSLATSGLIRQQTSSEFKNRHYSRIFLLHVYISICFFMCFFPRNFWPATVTWATPPQDVVKSDRKRNQGRGSGKLSRMPLHLVSSRLHHPSRRLPRYREIWLSVSFICTTSGSFYTRLDFDGLPRRYYRDFMTILRFVP